MPRDVLVLISPVQAGREGAARGREGRADGRVGVAMDGW